MSSYVIHTALIHRLPCHAEIELRLLIDAFDHFPTLSPTSEIIDGDFNLSSVTWSTITAPPKQTFCYPSTARGSVMHVISFPGNYLMDSNFTHALIATLQLTLEESFQGATTE